MAEAPIKGKVGTVEFRLADWLDPQERYQRRYLKVDPEGGVVSDQPGLHPDSGVRLWSIRAWSGGEGETLWTREDKRYRKSDGVTLVDIGEGLQLSRLAETTQDSTGSSDFVDGRRFGYGRGSLWTVDTDTAYEWDRTNQRWKAGVTVGASVADATSVTDGDDTWMYSGHTGLGIRRWKSGSNETHYGTGTGDDFSYAPVVRSWGGRLYALDGDDLYEIDKDNADTRTIKADVPGSSDDYLTTTPWSYNRMTLSDKGPIWLQRLDNGQTLIWEYNVNADRQDIIGKLAVDFAYPYSVFFTNGFVVVGFRYANSHSEAGPAFVHFQRGAQKGTAGPFRAPSGATASKPVLIGGQIGDDVIGYFDGRVWAYNVTEAGLRELAAEVESGGPPEDMVTFGQEIFLGPFTSNKVERYRADKYVASGTLDTARDDFDYPGLEKLLQDVGVVTDPLPAGTSVKMKVSVDGGTAVALESGAAHDTDTERRFAWKASDAAAGNSDLIGYEFELQPELATTDEDETPTVRQLWATATGTAHRIQWILAVDCTRFSHKDIDDLNGLRGKTVTFEDPWQNRGSDGADSVVVTVEDVVTPERLTSETTEQVHGLLKLQSRDLVDVLGGS